MQPRRPSVDYLKYSADQARVISFRVFKVETILDEQWGVFWNFYIPAGDQFSVVIFA
jgi:hypothetical protein